jgi:hypothetical protein
MPEGQPRNSPVCEPEPALSSRLRSLLRALGGRVKLPVSDAASGRTGQGKVDDGLKAGSTSDAER